MKLTEVQAKVVEENHNLIYGYANDKKLDLEEWYDLLAIELCKAVIKHNPEKGKLSTYYYMRCNSLVGKEFKKSLNQKNFHMGLYSLEESEVGYGEEDYINHGLLDMLENEEYGQVIRLRSEGYTQVEVADMLGMSQSQVSRMIGKAREEYDK